MKVAVTSALSWPYIRRGNRCGYDLARWLAARGHDVTFITPTPGRRERVLKLDGMTVHRIPLKESIPLTALKIQKLVTFALTCKRALDQGGYDIVQATHPIDACAASRHRAGGGAPYVYVLIDCNPFHPPMRLGLTVLRSGLKRASELSVLSDFMNRRLQADHGRQALMLALAADLDRFTLSETRDPSTTRILCTASLSDPRKRVDILVRAFEVLLTHLPNAELLLSGQSNDETQSLLARLVSDETRKHITFLGLGRQTDLPKLYQTATISVLPSINEAFGLVVVESLASGTPVVATRSGAIPEILDDHRVGILFPESGGPTEVCDALLQGLELSKREETPLLCRSHVERRYSWDVVGRAYEELYERILDREARPPANLPVKPQLSTTVVPYRDPVQDAIDDALDGKEMTGEEYFVAARDRPAYEALGRLWLKRSSEHNRILVIAPELDLLSAVLVNLGAQVVSQSEPSHKSCPPSGIVAAFLSDPGVAQLAPLIGALQAPHFLVLLRPKSTEAESSTEEPSTLEIHGFQFTIMERTHVAPTERILRGWGSTPIKTLIKSSAGRLKDAVLPTARSHELLWLLRR